MSTDRFPIANAENDGYTKLNKRRHLCITAAEETGRDLVLAETKLLQAQKVAKAEALVAGIKSAAGQDSYSADHTISQQGAVGLAKVIKWAASKTVDAVEAEGKQMNSVAATLRKEMEIASQGGQP